MNPTTKYRPGPLPYIHLGYNLSKCGLGGDSFSNILIVNDEIDYYADAMMPLANTCSENYRI